jgi:NTP pyrophosphatase (non-canonical NTP hydrolase)
MSTCLNALAKEVHATAIDRGWWNNGASRDVGMVLALIHSEVSEALEEYRDGHSLFETYYSTGGKPEGVPSELADVMIRVLDMCAAYMIDIDAAMSEKMAYNKTRPLRHGGKLA